MSLKLAVLAVLIAVVSSAHFDVHHRHRQFEIQNEMIREQNEKIREHHQHENYHRNQQLRQLEEQRRVLDQLNRNQYHNYQSYYPQRYYNNYDNSNYGFNYAVVDRFSGDVKSHQENRFGENVEGQYSLIDADGMERIVSYRDNGDGMQTEVTRQYPSGFNQNYHNFQYRPFQPSIFSSTAVSKNDDGQHSDYVTKTTSNF